MDFNEIFQWVVLVFLFVDAGLIYRSNYLETKIRRQESEKTRLIMGKVELLESKMNDIHPDLN